MFHFHNKIRFFNICVLCGIISIYLMVELLLINSENLILTWFKQSAHVSLLLSDNITEKDYQALYAELENDKSITKIQEVSSEQAFKLIAPYFNIESLKNNQHLFPKTIEFGIIPEHHTNSKSIIKKYKVKKSVTDIVFAQQSFEILKFLTNHFNNIHLVISNLSRAFILMLVFYFLFFLLDHQKGELQLLHLIGASSSTIYKLFLNEIFFIVGLSILLSYITIYSIYLFYIKPISENILSFYPTPIIFFGWQDLVINSCFILITGGGCTFWVIKIKYNRLLN